MTDEIELLKNKNIGKEAFLEAIRGYISAESMTPMEAILHYCEVNEVEIETVIPFVKGNQKLKAELQQDAERLNFIKKTSKLPVE